MTVADIFFVHQRGLMNSIYIWAANFGSSLAPVAAGFVTASQGWRWVWWYMTIFFGVVLVAVIFGFEESKFDWTKAPLVGEPVASEEMNISSIYFKGPGAQQLRACDAEKQAPFIGTTLGSLICGAMGDRMILALAKRNKGVYEPEMRLWLFVPFIPFQVAGAFWFGYALQGGQSWVAMAFAWGICAFGAAPISSIALTYMTDAYNEVGRGRAHWW